MRRKNTIAKTRIDRKLLCLGSLAPLYGGKKNGFFRVGNIPTFSMHAPPATLPSVASSVYQTRVALP